MPMAERCNSNIRFKKKSKIILSEHILYSALTKMAIIGGGL